MLKILSSLKRFKVDYSLVGRRDGLALREPDPSLWRKNDYRRGYADGLIATAKRMAKVQLVAGGSSPVMQHDLPECGQPS